MDVRPDFSAHRARVLESLDETDAVLLFGGPQHHRNGDAEFRYRPSSDLYWLTGWDHPDVAVLLKKSDPQFTMFVQPKNREREIWTGIRPGPEGAVHEFGADAAHDFAELPELLPDLLTGLDTLHYSIADDGDNDAIVMGSIRKAARMHGRGGAAVPETFVSPTKLLHELRLIKTKEEIATLQRACDITADAHIAAMRQASPGMNEYQIDALLYQQFLKNGGNGPGYTSIVAAGENACILHYITNRSPLKDGDLLLIDAGCEYGFYTSDVTRTFPINGTFTKPQSALYDIVLASQIASINAMRSGSRYEEYGQAGLEVIVQGLIDLGLINQSFDECLETKSYRQFYMHGIGHWLGLDVHDVGFYGRAGQSRPLKPGMVLTVEPGIYVAPDDTSVPEEYRGIGIRIEDDILIDDGGPINLTEAIPKTRHDVERTCAGH